MRWWVNFEQGGGRAFGGVVVCGRHWLLMGVSVNMRVVWLNWSRFRIRDRRDWVFDKGSL